MCTLTHTDRHEDKSADHSAASLTDKGCCYYAMCCCLFNQERINSAVTNIKRVCFEV